MILFFALLFLLLLASIPTGLIIATLYYDCDLRKLGSGNIGMTNVWRLLGWKPALFTLLGDLGKGMLGIVLISSLTSSTWIISLASILLVLGHCYSIYLQFSGGKGVATAGGIILALHPMLFAMIALTWVLVNITTHKSSLSALISAVVLLPLGYWCIPDYIGMLLVLILIIFWRHKNNIQRLHLGGS